MRAIVLDAAPRVVVKASKPMARLSCLVVCLGVAVRGGNLTRFAVCLTGQLRTGTYVELQENLRLALKAPLEDADVFAVVAREHALKHQDYHIPRGGCYKDRRKCARRDGSDGDAWKGLRGPFDLDKNWGGRQPAVRPAASDAELEAFRSGPLGPLVVDVLNDTAAVAEATRRHGPARPDLFQRSLRARNRVCLDHVEAAEARRGARYAFVVRIRPDYAFYNCRMPPGRLWPTDAKLEARGVSAPASQWFTSHMDLWEAMGRDAADANLGMWNREVPEACHLMPRVESCPYYVMCGRGGLGFAAERMGGPLDGLGPSRPGEYLRPCCDADDIPRQVLDPPPDAWCPLERAPYLQDWWFTQQSKPNAHNARETVGLPAAEANAALGPHCAKITVTSDDDDDDDGGDDVALAVDADADDEYLSEYKARLSDDDPRVVASYVHDWDPDYDAAKPTFVADYAQKQAETRAAYRAKKAAPRRGKQTRPSRRRPPPPPRKRRRKGDDDDDDDDDDDRTELRR